MNRIHGQCEGQWSHGQRAGPSSHGGMHAVSPRENWQQYEQWQGQCPGGHVTAERRSGQATKLQVVALVACETSPSLELLEEDYSVLYP